MSVCVCLSVCARVQCTSPELLVRSVPKLICVWRPCVVARSLTPLLRRIGCAVSQTTAGAETRQVYYARSAGGHSLRHYTRLTAPCPGLPRWAGTIKVKPIWILLRQTTVNGSGISWAICKSRCRQITMPAPFHSVAAVGHCLVKVKCLTTVFQLVGCRWSL